MKYLLLKLFLVVFVLCGILSVGAQNLVELRYELSGDQKPVFVKGGDFAYAVPEVFSEMVVNNYSAPSSKKTVWPDDENDYGAVAKKTQRTRTVNGIWPAKDSDIVSSRYIEYGITAKEGTVLGVNKISMYVGAAGGSAMRCKIYYSVDNFRSFLLLADYSKGMAPYNMYHVLNESIDADIKAGESLKVRVYPWYKIAKSGPLFCVSEVNIQGVSTSVNGAE